jgi:hypothetical protein
MNHPGFGRDSLLGSGDQADEVAQLVQGLELHRWPASAGSVQSTVVIPIHPCCGGDVDFLDGMPRPRGLINSFLYKPISDSARALSRASPTVPIEASTPESIKC